MTPEPNSAHQHFTSRKPLLSACIVVHNEGPVIQRCLQSLACVAGEILVVHDGPCTDDTLDIADRYSARVFVRPFAGHSEHHRPFAYEQARGEWLLNIDADEFLSPEMAAVLPSLMSRCDVAAYAFVWPLWDGARPLTWGGPHRPVLMRRSAIEMVGMIHRGPDIRGPIEKRPEILHHQPSYNNYTWRTTVTKQRRWASLHGQEIINPFSKLPTFNYSGPTQWPTSRRVLNYLSPILAIPYGIGIAARRLLDKRWKGVRASPEARLRVSFFAGMYRGMVELYVARHVYVVPLIRASRRVRDAMSSNRR